MKTLIVLSDSHGKKGRMKMLQPLFAENDYIVHLGDGAGDMFEARNLYPEKVYQCKGNCDITYEQSEFVLEVEGVKFFCCHGHRYKVKSELLTLALRAKELGCQVALYGHTHRASYEEVEGVICINPGNMTDYVNAGYCYLVVHEGKVTHTFVTLQ